MFRFTIEGVFLNVDFTMKGVFHPPDSQSRGLGMT